MKKNEPPVNAAAQPTQPACMVASARGHIEPAGLFADVQHQSLGYATVIFCGRVF